MFEIALINILPAATGAFSFESGLTVKAQTSLIYNGVLGAGADNGTVVVTFNNYSFDSQLPLLVRLDIDDGLGGTGQIDRQLNQIVNIGSPFDLALPLGLGEFAGVNFGGSLNLKFTFFGNLQDDFELEQIVLEAETVPDPSTMAIAAMGLFGIAGYGLSRRRQRERVNQLLVHQPDNGLNLNQHLRGSQAMRFLKKLLLSLAAAATIVTVHDQASALVIDTFDNAAAGSPLLTPLGVWVSSPTRPTDTFTDAPAIPGVLGGSRKSTLTFISGPSNSLSNLNLIEDSLPNRQLSISSGTNTVIRAELEYAFLGTDFTQGGSQDGISLQFDTSDHAASVTISLDIYGVGTSSLTLPKGIGPEDLQFAYSSFSIPIAPIHAIIGLRLRLDGAANGQYDLEVLGTYGDTPAVPEPSTVAMAGLGLIGLTAWGWRRRRRTLAEAK
jgi:hypothetical protein